MMLARFSLVAVFVLSVMTVACGSPRTDAPGDAIGTPESGGPHLPSAFTVSRIADFKEAAAVVGFDIPKSDLYKLHWPYLFIQPGVELGPDIPRQVGAIYEVGAHFVEVTIGPASFWPEDGRKKGERRNLGGRDGWYLVDKYNIRFSTPSSTSDRFGEVWMLVDASPQVDAQLESFVASLKPVVP